MKKAGWIATITAGVVLVGGGAWGATMLAVDDEASTTATDVTPTPEPSATPEVTPTPSAEPTPTPTPTPEVVETPAPVATEEPAPEPAQPQGFLEIARADLSGWGVTMDDAAIYAAGDRVCAGLAEGQGLPEINAFDGAVGDGVESGFRFIAREHYC